MSKVVILGLGNDLLTDDAVGLRIAHEVRGRLAGDARIHVHETTEMGLALLDLIVGYDALVVVDSIQTGRQPPGFIHQLEPSNCPQPVARTPHAIGIDRLCALGQTRGLAVPRRMRMIAVEVGDPFSLGTDMTPEVEQAIDDAVDAAVACAMEFAEPPQAPAAV